MRRYICSIAALLALFGTARANQDERCLVVHDISSFSQGGRHTIDNGVQSVIVKTYANSLWKVTFQGYCPYHLNSHFIYQDWQLGNCLKPGDSLQLNGGGACMVADVQQIPSDLPPGHGRGGPVGY